MLRWVLAAALFLTPGIGWAASKSASFAVTLTVRETCNANLREDAAPAGDLAVQCDTNVPFRLERPDPSQLQDMLNSGDAAQTRSANTIWVVF